MVKLAQNGLLTHFNPMFHFYTLLKRQQTKGFLTLYIETEFWFEMG